MSYTKADQTKKVKIKRVVVKSVAQLKKRVQAVINKYIKLRDKDLKCISCGIREIEHAGHYIAQGSSGALRYNELNINGQCAQCNVWKHGNLINYRRGLVKLIGEDLVKYLEDHQHDIKKWTREELENLLTTYQEKIKDME